ncbi:sigma-54 dependent transcriptional regulator [Robbsia sp. KACC 23696]|uniref:sigma-54-dependent transcriptional regulator n=1 Tax=Robbsia sp. KACC 23696 TaxID=3149231 RepID=UPI00325BB92F
MPHALIVEDDPNSLSGLAAILDADGFSVDTAMTLAEARQALTRFIPDVVLIDLNLPDGKGLDLLPSLPVTPPDGNVPVIVMTGNATVESAIAGLRHGIWDYLLKPVSIPRLRSLLARIPRPYELTEEVQALKLTLRQLGRYGPLVGRSPAMQRLYDDIDRIAATEGPVLLVGESGSGKETVARAIHHGSRRRKAPFVSFDSRSSTGEQDSRPASVLLFGQERTGAPLQTVMGEGRTFGACERATGGTLYIDDVTHLSVEQQRQLVAVMTQHTFRRVGGTHDIPADFRLVAGSNEDPMQALGEGRLRDDLYRLLVPQAIAVPALRERFGDVEMLAQYFVDQLNESTLALAGTQGNDGSLPQSVPKYLASLALRGLEQYQWPGNVRELQEAVESAYKQAGPMEATIESLAPVSGGQKIRPGSVEITVGMPLEEVEELLIRATLEAVGGTRHRAASMLGISPKTLYNKLQRMKLED